MIETVWSSRQPPSRALLVVAAVFGVVTLAGILVLDVPIARTLAEYQPSSWWESILSGLEWLLLLPLHLPIPALPLLLVVGMLVMIFVEQWRSAAPAWMVVTGVSLASRLTTGWLKDGTGRFRPAEWLKHHVDGTFGWQGGIAFPSGHVVLFAGILIPLIVVAPPRWQRPLLIATIVLVGFVSAARMAVGAHFLSDTTGAITWVVLWTWVLAMGVRPAR